MAVGAMYGAPNTAIPCVLILNFSALPATEGIWIINGSELSEPVSIKLEEKDSPTSDLNETSLDDDKMKFVSEHVMNAVWALDAENCSTPSPGIILISAIYDSRIVFNV